MLTLACNCAKLGIPGFPSNKICVALFRFGPSSGFGSPASGRTVVAGDPATEEGLEGGNVVGGIERAACERLACWACGPMVRFEAALGGR